ncbi:MAG: oligosaccharide repeat unit polymerase [Ignavibacteriales bacterium]|nr:oligosaccharide repeat unit polymerase [Ignavibacteriales bacterium]
MSLVSLFCFLIAFLIVLSCFRRGADIFSPARVFGFIWTVAIGLADLKLSRLQHEWSAFAWITMLIGLLSFLFGVFSVSILFIGKSTYSINEIRRRQFSFKISPNKLYLSILILFCLYTITYLIEWFKAGVLPLFAQFPDRARSEFPIFGIHLCIGAMPVILFLVIEYLSIVRTLITKKIMLTAIFLITVISYFFLMNRLYYVLFFILALGFTYYSTKFIRLRTVGFAGIVLVGLLAFLQYFREARYVENFLYIVSEMRYSSKYALLTGPYMYIVMNLENFARAVPRLESFTFGFFSFDFLMAITGLKHWLITYFGLQERIYLVSGYNTFPFMWDYYYDFGILGLTTLSGSLGFVCALIHRWMRTQPSLLNVSLYAIILFVIVISFFTNALTSLNFIFNSVLIIFVHILIKRKKSRLIPMMVHQ